MPGLPRSLTLRLIRAGASRDEITVADRLYADLSLEEQARVRDDLEALTDGEIAEQLVSARGTDPGPSYHRRPVPSFDPHGPVPG